MTRAESRCTEPFHHTGSVFINFRNLECQWVDIKKFALPAGVADRTALAMLISHEQYGDNYAGGEPGDDPQRHGPYWRDRVDPMTFEPGKPAVEEERIRVWATQHGEPSAEIGRLLEDEVYQPFHAADVLYRLTDLGSAAFHDWASVHTEFHELVVIRRDVGQLVLVVAADD